MSDADLQALRRAWRSDPGLDTELVYLRALLRAGSVDPVSLEASAYLGYAAAVQARGEAPDPAGLSAEGRARLEPLVESLPFVWQEVLKLSSGLGDGHVYSADEVGMIFQFAPERVASLYDELSRGLSAALLYGERPPEPTLTPRGDRRLRVHPPEATAVDPFGVASALLGETSVANGRAEAGGFELVGLPAEPLVLALRFELEHRPEEQRVFVRLELPLSPTATELAVDWPQGAAGQLRGQAPAGVYVVAERRDGEQLERVSALTNGAFEFPQLSPGSYQVYTVDRQQAWLLDVGTRPPAGSQPHQALASARVVEVGPGATVDLDLS